MITNKSNLFAYVFACTALIGAVQYPNVPLFWWFVIGLGSALLFVYSGKAPDKKLVSLGIDVFNLVVLLFAKSKLENRIEARITQNQK